MTASAQEIQAMRRAIATSALGIGTCSPNPPVGCVILDPEGVAVGSGYHLRKGEAHAEANALADAGERARGGTAVVTLEPCNHVGVTPACRQALLDAGVTRVVIALIDPTSRGEGGAAVLRAAGVDVEVGVLEAEATVVLGDWMSAQRLQRPINTWAYRIDKAGNIHAPAAIGDLRRRFDLVVLDDEQLVEGVPGGHGRFETPAADVLREDVIAALKTIFNCGARTLLTIADTRWSRSLHDSDTIDHVVVQIARPPSGTAIPNWALPEHFALVRVDALPDELHLTATRSSAVRVRGDRP